MGKWEIGRSGYQEIRRSGDQEKGIIGETPPLKGVRGM
jgi:hypothetical protein